jgi:acyl transferase domain-containing protein/acyl carrier protein
MQSHAEKAENLGLSKKILLALTQAKNKILELEQQMNEPIAIVGMGCRFPGEADNVEEYWKIILNETDAISEVTEDRWNSKEFYDPNPDTPGKMYTNNGGFLKNIDRFDAKFFGFSPREASIMDPQQKLVLEVAWEALENSGHFYDRIQGCNTGVFIGVTTNDYSQYLLRNSSFSEIDPYLSTGNVHNAIAGRVSYLFGFRGPCLSLDTACSSSLVAVHLACQSIRSGECDQALAGGVNVILAPETMIATSKARIISPDGRCKTFDKAADGFGRGEGCGIVVLKRLTRAIADRDTIHAIIRSSAINHGGASGGFTIPNGRAQEAVIKKALENAKIDPLDISYVEVHGSGTELGDSIEVGALGMALCDGRDFNDPLVIGTVKTNFGHLESASGVAGLIKVVLSLQHKIIPKHLHFNNPTDNIRWEKLPIKVPRSAMAWEPRNNIRRAGVSSFGFSGINAHVIVEESQPLNSSGNSRTWKTVLLSAKTETALVSATDNLITFLQNNPEADLADVEYTLKVGRKSFNYRRMILCKDAGDLIDSWNNKDQKFIYTNYNDPIDRSIVFMFPGVGDQYINMAKDIYSSEQIFRRHVDYCCDFIKQKMNVDLRRIMFSEEEKYRRKSGPAHGRNFKSLMTADMHQDDELTLKLGQTINVQPVIFVIEYALAQLWMHWGIKPAAMIGYSVGEYVAACLAGVMSVEDALMLVYKRAELIQQSSEGSMLAIPLPEEELQGLLPDGISIAIINSPMMCIVSGPLESISLFRETLEQREIPYKQIPAVHPFHSPALEPIRDQFIEFMGNIKFNSPSIPYISNVTGDWITSDQAADPGYWMEHTVKTVRFADGIGELLKSAGRIFLEVGPGQALGSFVMQHAKLEKNNNQYILSSLPIKNDDQSDDLFICKTVGRLWLLGVSIDWEAYHSGEERRRISLPTYPFERQRYWFENIKKTDPYPAGQDVMAKNADIADWFYFPVWKQTVRQMQVQEVDVDRIRKDHKECWIVFLDDIGVGSAIIDYLKSKNHEIISVTRGDGYYRTADDSYVINPQSEYDYTSFFENAMTRDADEYKILHLWNITQNNNRNGKIDFNERESAECQYLGFYSLLFMAQSIIQFGINKNFKIGMVTNSLFGITGEEVLRPERATLTGACMVIPLEIENINCKNIDIVLPDNNNVERKECIVQKLVREVDSGLSDNIVAYRADHRWIQLFEASRIEKPKSDTALLKENGVYMVTGGLGGLGMAIAEYLALNYHAKIILIGRSSFPDRSEWNNYLSSHDVSDVVSNKIIRLQQYERAGATILVSQADVSDLDSMSSVVSDVVTRYGVINGVFHAAGVPGAGMIQLKSFDMVEKVFAAKVKGTLVLHEVLKNIPVDFIVLYSSKTSVCGIFGQIDYCAANFFMDVFAHYVSSDIRVISINWDEWEWDNWQTRIMDSNSDLYKILQENRRKFGLSFSEGIEVLNRSLSLDSPQVAISTRNLHTVIKEHRSYTSSNITSALSNIATKQFHPRPSIGVEYVAPANEVEKKIERIWCELLGFEKIGIHDNVFELGGNSLVAMQLISKLHKAFQVNINPRSLFELSTIAELALHVENMLIEKIEKLSEDEAKSLIAS